MVGKSIETRAGTSDIAGPRSNPSIFTGHINELVLVECGKRNVPRSTLPFLFGSLFVDIVTLRVSFHELQVPKGLFSIRTKGLSNSGKGEAREGRSEPHYCFQWISVG